MIKLLKRIARKILDKAKAAREAYRVSRLPQNSGHCNICESETVFIEYTPWLRGNYKCKKCQSQPRNRALVNVLNKYAKDWHNHVMHESSPSGPLSVFLKKKCRNYSSSHYFDDVARGEYKGEFRSEDLSAMTFPDESFDLIVTSDVFEHVMDPENAFKEIARILKPGGLHIFTIPLVPGKERSERRASLNPDGTIEFLKPAEYHGNPIGGKGSLVTYDWGLDFPDFIYKNGGMTTTVYLEIDRKKGLDGLYLEVFISRKEGEAN